MRYLGHSGEQVTRKSLDAVLQGREDFDDVLLASVARLDPAEFDHF